MRGGRRLDEVALWLAILVASLGSAACDLESARDAVDDFDVIIELDPIETTVSVALLDAATRTFITGSAELTFQGQDAASVIDLYSDPLIGMEVDGGLASFGIRNASSPSETNPVLLRVTASARGYHPASTLLHLDSKGAHAAAVLLESTDPSTLPAGTGTVAAEAPLSSGALSSSQELVTTPSEPGTVARVALPIGAVPLTSDGARAAGRLDVRLDYRQAASGIALDLGATSEATIRRTSGREVQAVLAPLALLRMEARDASGAMIRSFDRPIEFSFEIPAGLADPASGSTFTGDDALFVLHYDEDAGIWTEVGPASLHDSASKTLGKTGSFSGESTGMYGVVVLGYDPVCQVDANLVDNPGGGSLLLDFLMPGGLSGRTLRTFTGRTTKLTTFVPRHTNVSVVSSAPYLITSGPKANTGSCTGPVSFNVIFNAPMQYDRATVDLLFSSSEHPCPSGALQVSGGGLPTLAIWYKRVGATDDTLILVADPPTWRVDTLGRLTGGTLTVLNAPAGDALTFVTTLNGERHERPLTFAGPTATLDLSADIEAADLCAR